jgi:hypothetical protein
MRSLFVAPTYKLKLPPVPVSVCQQWASLSPIMHHASFNGALLGRQPAKKNFFDLFSFFIGLGTKK